MRLVRPAVLVVAVPIAFAVLGGPGAVAADEAGKAPKAILADVKRDMGKVRSYRFSGTTKDSSGTMSLSGVVTAHGQTDFTMRQGGATVRVLRVSASAVYLKANAEYWKTSGGSNGPALAKKVADRWVKAPSTVTQPFTELYNQLTPTRLALCTTVGIGTPAKGGTTTLDGRKVVVIIEKGDKPGTTPGKLYVSATGPALPLREIQTGRRRSGGHLDARCQDKNDDSTAGDIRLSDFDKPVTLTAPKGAIAPPTGGGGISI
jgi:hypothetical protein